MNAVIIGCGGIGGWLASALVKMMGEGDTLALVDKDKFEKHNRDRQLHCNLGTCKSDAVRSAIHRHARCEVISYRGFIGLPDTDDWFRAKTLAGPDTVWFCGADNHRARLNTLKAADTYGGMAVVCANEYTDAEAYVYLPEWANGPLDPRMYYPEILTDRSDDPVTPPCTGEVLESTPQLALANMSAANYGMWLWYYWSEIAGTITDPDAQRMSPYHVLSSSGKVRQITIGEARDVGE